MNVTQQKTDSDHIQVGSRLFGPITVPGDTCLLFEEGIFGFAGERNFVLLPAAREGLYWMQDVNDGSLALLMVDPFKFFPDYVADLDDCHRNLIQANDKSEIAVLSVVTLPRDHEDRCTVNLQGPVIINFSARRGCQIILEDSGFGTKHALDLAGQVASRISS